MRVLKDIARATGRSVKRLSLRKVTRKSILATAVIIAGFFVGTKVTNIDVFAQSDDKSIGLLPLDSFSKPQIKIKEVRVGGNAKKFDENFRENSDWLSRTSFQIENVSGKSIVYLRINVWFPETTTSGPVMIYPLTFGQRPGSKFQNTDSFLLTSGDTVDIPLSPKYSDISRFVGHRHLIGTIHKIQFQVSFIVFDDGTAWSVGTFMLQDPNDPNRYIPILPSPEDAP